MAIIGNIPYFQTNPNGTTQRWKEQSTTRNCLQIVMGHKRIEHDWLMVEDGWRWLKMVEDGWSTWGLRALCGQKSEVSAKKRTLGSCAACLQAYLFSFQGFLPAYPSYLVTLCEANLDSFEAIPLVLGSCLIHYCATAAGLVLMLHKVA